MMLFLLFMWFLISIAFITTLIITVVKAIRKRKVKGILITTIILFVVGLICLVGSIAASPSNDDYTVSKSEDNNSSKSSKSNDEETSNNKKNLNVGDTIRLGGVDIKVAKAEFVQPDSEYSEPDKGRILKVTYDFKNNGDDQILADSTDFNITVDSNTQKNFFGMDDTNDSFTEFLNKGNSISGYEYYDVPEAEEYKAELNFEPDLETYKANWIIKNSDIK
ncbi:DUF4352 domain-containing protein [Staphylococcus xylosus]|uniref:DUF4352 domain-containing protein n=1 Tax=Staphylococcus xylosus TaxID=1288 RepID=A0A418IJP5_STAXY|nr:DUF4352 domain-containing protein [Staphylococcus xylosus]PTI58849.1 hypothetical protein BU103_03445 [Staphylococcus xylosus]RIN06108.1 DUF4352 domain-containing protein [Staphylococcus xylosus]